MPDDAAEVDTIAKAVEAGTDGITVPTELVDEHDKPTPEARSLYAQIATMGIARWSSVTSAG